MLLFAEKYAVCLYEPSFVRAECSLFVTLARCPLSRSASTSGRPCIDEGRGSPSMCRNVGAKSTLPLGTSTVAPCRMSGPAAISVLWISNGLELP